MLVVVAVALATCGVELLVVDDELDPPPHAASASEAQSASGARRHAGRPRRRETVRRLRA
jgi:hypothetical protein